MAAELNQHIAILFEFPTLNGGEHSMLTVLERLRTDGGCQFTAVAPPDGPLAHRLSAIGIPLVPFSVRSPSSGIKRDVSNLLAELHEIVTHLQPDIVHANSLSMSRLLGQVCCQLRVPSCTGHIRDIMKVSRQAISGLNCLNRIAAVSEATRRFHIEQGLEPERVEVVRNGVDFSRFYARPKGKFRSQLLPQLPPDTVVLLNVGQICLRKGQFVLAQAVIRVVNSRKNVHLVLVGERHSAKAESIAYEQSIIDEFDNAGLAAHLHRPGYSENVEHWMNAADLLVHTAHQEPLGRVLLEAAASELPIIATNVGGTSEILEHGKSGILVPARNVDAMVAALQSAIDEPRQCRSLAANAVKHIKQDFSVNQACCVLLKFWQGVR